MHTANTQLDDVPDLTTATFTSNWQTNASGTLPTAYLNGTTCPCHENIREQRYAPLILNLSIRCRSVATVTFRPPHPRERTRYHLDRGWVRPRAGLDNLYCMREYVILIWWHNLLRRVAQSVQ